MRKVRNSITGLMILAILILVSGCNTIDNKKSIDNEKLKVITTLFPQYDFVKEIAKDKVDVSLLLPPGVESHAYDPTPQDMTNIKKADIFVYTGQYMEPWAEKIVEIGKNEKLVIVDTSKGIELIDEEDHEHEEEHGHEEGYDHEHGGKDPHIWLDPICAQKMVDNIVEGLITADKGNEKFYRENGEEYKKKLQQLDEKFIETFRKTKYNKIMYGGHFAFGYFAKRYGLEHISPYNGFTPNAEPTPKRIAELIKNIESSGIKVIYYEELINPKVAKIISDQTGAEMLLLHGAHNLSKSELESGISYIEIMEQNLERLKQGLGYGE